MARDHSDLRRNETDDHNQPSRHQLVHQSHFDTAMFVANFYPKWQRPVATQQAITCVFEIAFGYPSSKAKSSLKDKLCRLTGQIDCPLQNEVRVNRLIRSSAGGRESRTRHGGLPPFCKFPKWKWVHAKLIFFLKHISRERKTALVMQSRGIVSKNLVRCANMIPIYRRNAK